MAPALVSALGVLLGLLAFAGLRLWRACGAANEADWGGPWLNRLDGLNRLFCRRFHRLRAAPVPLPPAGPAVVVANHVSGLDPLLMAASCRRPLRFLIAREQYRRPGLTWLFRAIGCIPVDRGRNPERALRQALQALRAGEVVALFPHGTIHLDSDPPRPLKRGALTLARLTDSPVYPLRLAGIRGQGHTVRAVFMRSRARLVSHPPLDCATADESACLALLRALLEGRPAPLPGRVGGAGVKPRV